MNEERKIKRFMRDYANYIENMTEQKYDPEIENVLARYMVGLVTVNEVMAYLARAEEKIRREKRE